MGLTPYGAREWIAISALAIALAAAAWFFVHPLAAVPFLILWLAALSFFRDPWRRVPTELPRGVMISPADGKISAIERVDHHAATGGPAVVIRIFLSVLNVHVNRAPCDARVVELRYAPGKFLNAQTEESARVNESNLILLEFAGEPMGVRQVAGLIARRIVCPLAPGDRLERGQKFGMIKFGSTTELILPRPDSVEVHVAIGDNVRGGLTTLATLQERQGGS